MSSSTTSGFTSEQLAELGKELDPSRAKTDPQGNIQGTYLESFDVIQRANEIFGYDGWEDSGSIRYIPEIPAFLAHVTVTAYAGDRTISHEDTTCVKIVTSNPETASKDAYTTAMKRALRKFGDQFGNSLYDKTSELHAQATPVGGGTSSGQYQRTTAAAPQPRNNGATAGTPNPRATGQPYRFPPDVPQDAIPENPVCEFSGEPFTGFTSSTGRACDPRTEAAFAYRDTGGHLIKKRYQEQWKESVGNDTGSDFPDL